ncbi:MAG: amidohydrolase family protein [Bacteroidetes bacterium]|uniref:Amidohydrolase family protein n=1 Tax=Candidatus Cryptobacteroides faecipullorum TaxID=2840764 RepID=A0A9D9I5Y3_9BACT|nr:amidohydrolase family protein [Candidatus Cryptobacteroides faecipullorum]
MKRIAAEYLYTLDSYEPLVNGFVEYDDDGTIVSVGECEDVGKEETFYKGALVPGFVNTHCHIELSHLQGKFAKKTGMAGFIDQINALRDISDRTSRMECIRKWMDRLWSQGVSAMGDISNGDESFPAKAASPMYTRTFLEVFGSEPEDCAKVMESVGQLQEKVAGYGLDAAPTPHSCYTMSPELLTAASRAALDSGYLSYHSQESLQEEQMLVSGSGALYENRKRLGMSTPPVTGRPSLFYFLDRIGKIHPAPFEEHILLVHEVCLTEEAADAVNDKLKNAFVALCPMSNIFIHDTLPPVALMRRKGMKITVGTDSLSSNDTLDIVGEMHCLQKAFPYISLGEILTWACRNGALFLGKEKGLGTIAPGKRPGIVLIEGLDADGRLTDGSFSGRII